MARAGQEVHVIAPLATQTRDATISSLVVHGVKGSTLFGWPGALANAKTNPLLLAHVVPFVMAARREMHLVGRVDRVIGHWIIPAGVPLLWDHPAPLELVAHGADVRLLCALPGALRGAMMARLLDRQTRFRFVATTLRQTLADALPTNIAERLLAASYIEPAAIEVPDGVWTSVCGQTEGFVVAIGRLLEFKRFDLAIRAAALEQMPIVIVGDGPMRAQLELVARETGAQVTFTGLLPRNEALAWLGASRALVHPSRTEGAPTVIREARALGVPVIATASGDVVAWARADAEIEVVEPAAEALAVALRKLPSRRREVGEGVRG